MLEAKKQEATSSGDANATDGHFTVDEATFWEFYNNQGAASEGWQQKLDYKGSVEVLLFQKTIKHGKTESYINKTKLKFKGIKKPTILSFFENIDKYMQEGVKECKIDKDENGNLTKMYQRIKIPLMSEREMVL